MADDLDRFVDELNANRRPGEPPLPTRQFGNGGNPQGDGLDALIAELQSAPASGPTRQPHPTPRKPTLAPAHPAPAPTEGQSAMLGLGDSVAFGFLDEAGGLADSIVPTANRENVWTSGRSFGDILSGNIAKNRQDLARASKANPKSFTAGQVVGGLVIPFGAGAKGALQVAKVGAVQGAAYGVGSGEGLGDRVAKGAAFGAGGAVIGAALGKAVDAVAPRIGKLFGRGGKTAADDAEGLTGTVTDDSPATGSYPTREHETVEAWTQPDLRGERSPVAATRAGADDGAEELVPLHAEPVAGEGGGAGAELAVKPLGSISRAGLQDLQDQVAGFRARVEEVGPRAVDVTSGSAEGRATGAFRLGNLGDGPETMSLLGALTRQLPSKGAKTDAELMATAQAAAREMGTGDPEAVAALAREVAGPLGSADNAIAILRTVQRRAADSVEVFHGSGIDWSTATDEMVQQAGQAIYNVQRLNELVLSAKAGVGRALRVFQLPDSDSYLAALARGENVSPNLGEARTVPALPGSREEISDWLELWGMVKGNPDMQSDLLAGTLTVPKAGHYLATSLANSFTASILSAPKTIILNVAGPALVNSVRSLERMGGGALGSLNPFATAAERAAQFEVARQTPLALFQTLGSIRDVFRYGVQAFKANQPILGGGGSVRDANLTFGPYNSNLLRAASVEPTWMQETGYVLGNAINIWPKAFARLNAGLDEMSKRLTYLNEVRVRAMVDAAGRGLSGDDAKAFVDQVLKGSVDEVGAATDDAILRAAERSTLTLEPGAEGSFPRKVTGVIQSLRKDYPLTRFILPVFNVPANALGETLRRVPLYERMPWMVEHAADLAGDNGPVSQAEAHGRALLGASFLTAGYLLNQAGLLTGAGPQDRKDYAVWRQTHEPYSLRIGDEWVSYRKLDILGGLLSIPATISDLSVYHKVEDTSWQQVILNGTGSLATWFKDQAALQTATALLGLGNDPLDNPGATLERIFGTIAAGMVPGSGLIRTVGVDATDPYARMKRSWADYIRAGIPGLSEELEPLRNVLGEPINRTADSLGEAVFPVSMAPVATYAKEPVLDELSRLYSKTGYGASSDPRTWLHSFADPTDVPLEDGRSLYFHAMQARATLRLDGRTLKEALGAMFDGPEYNEAVDADAGQAWTSRGQQSRAYMVKQLFGRYNKAIKAEIGHSSPIALRYLTAAAAKQRDDAVLHGVTLGQLVNDPDLYRANGVDPRAYQDKVTEGAAGDLLEALNGGSE